MLKNRYVKYKNILKHIIIKIKNRNNKININTAFIKIYSKGKFKNLDNQYVILKYGKGTLIDPDVIIESPEKIKIGRNCIIRKGVVLRPEGGEIVIGDNCVINHYCIFHGKGGIYIGDWTIMGPHCGLYAQNHTYNSFNTQITKQKNIGKGIYLMGDNWIGGHSVICDDVTLGKGAIIGANGTVVKSIPMASIAVGSPAKIIKKRYAGEWNFNKVERAAINGMPINIQKHVIKRGRLLRDLISMNDKILDVGCGEGFITSILSKKNPHITGCDYSDEAISIAKKQYPNIRFIYSNSTNLSFNNEVFTKVVFSDIAEHLLPIQLVKSLKEIERVLIKGGKIVLTTPLTSNGKNTSTYSHLYEYSKSEMESILAKIFINIELVNNDFGIFIALKR